MLQPKRTKYRKHFKIRKILGVATKGNKLTVGEFGLQSLESIRLHANQIESARKVIVRETKRKGKLWVRAFPDIPYTKKPAEVKLGKGKGDVEGYIAIIKKGRVIFELGGIEKATAVKALTLCAQKLPVKTRVILREQ
jgi:large subunit ribosomal protein L16